MSEGFFNRWSRRKREAGQDEDQSPLPAQPAELKNEGPGTPDRRPEPASSPLADAGQVRPHSQPSAAPLPTLEDARLLTPESDFQPFMQHGVGAEVRNAAMKKLFADPHFNVMDGLDIYIDDYSQPDPMPVGMLRKMASAQFMKLVPEEGSDGRPQDSEGCVAQVQGAQVVAQSPDPSATAETPHHDHPDLQLQPDPAAGSEPAEPGPR